MILRHGHDWQRDAGLDGNYGEPGFHWRGYSCRVCGVTALVDSRRGAVGVDTYARGQGKPASCVDAIVDQVMAS